MGLSAQSDRGKLRNWVQLLLLLLLLLLYDECNCITAVALSGLQLEVGDLLGKSHSKQVPVSIAEK